MIIKCFVSLYGPGGFPQALLAYKPAPGNEQLTRVNNGLSYST